MSKSKVMTMEQMKEKNRDVILTKEEYDAVVSQIETLSADLEATAETNEANETRIMYYKAEIDNLIAKCKAYKAKIKNQDDIQNANKEIAEQMKQNKGKLMDKLKNKQKSKYVRKTKEELQAEIEAEFKEYRKSYENDI
jgi:chromosome segregation ATPase